MHADTSRAFEKDQAATRRRALTRARRDSLRAGRFGAGTRISPGYTLSGRFNRVPRFQDEGSANPKEEELDA